MRPSRLVVPVLCATAMLCARPAGAQCPGSILTEADLIACLGDAQGFTVVAQQKVKLKSGKSDVSAGSLSPVPAVVEGAVCAPAVISRSMSASAPDFEANQVGNLLVTGTSGPGVRARPAFNGALVADVVATGVGTTGILLRVERLIMHRFSRLDAPFVLMSGKRLVRFGKDTGIFGTLLAPGRPVKVNSERFGFGFANRVVAKRLILQGATLR